MVFLDILPRLSALNASIAIHKTTLHRIFQLPVLFFETNPTGRILAR